jgi:hypothetical protein
MTRGRSNLGACSPTIHSHQNSWRGEVRPWRPIPSPPPVRSGGLACAAGTQCGSGPLWSSGLLMETRQETIAEMVDLHCPGGVKFLPDKAPSYYEARRIGRSNFSIFLSDFSFLAVHLLRKS